MVYETREAGRCVSRLVGRLDESVLLVQPYFRRWRGVYRLPKRLVKVTAASREVAHCTAPTINIFDQRFGAGLETFVARRNRFANLWSWFRRAIGRDATPLSLRGIYAVSKASEPSIIQTLEMAQQYLTDILDRLVVAWPKVLYAIREIAGKDVFQYLQPRLPNPPESLRLKFEIGVKLVRVAATAATEDGSPGDEDELEAVRRQIDERILMHYAMTVNTAIDQVVLDEINRAFLAPREELSVALHRFESLLASVERMTPAKHEALCCALEKLWAFACMADKEQQKQIRALADRLERTVFLEDEYEVYEDSDDESSVSVRESKKEPTANGGEAYASDRRVIQV
mgnify:CR=1 FL=1